MLYLLFFLAGLAGYGFYAYNALVKKLFRPAASYPNLRQVLPNKKIVICAGDSITHGNMSHDWVSDMAAHNPNFQFFNAGINADLSFTLMRRLGDVIALKPQHVNLLIGTNDVSFAMGREKHYYDLKKVLPTDAPSLASYGQNLKAIIERLQNETTASVSLMSLPVMSEDLAHPANQMADQYSAEIKKIAEETGVIYLPLRENQKAFLAKSGGKSKIKFEDTDWLIRKAGLAHHVFGTDWDSITRANGNQLTFDNLHFNSVGAGMIAALLEEALKDIFNNNAVNDSPK